jgi:hypothetical protein
MSERRQGLDTDEFSTWERDKEENRCWSVGTGRAKPTM